MTPVAERLRRWRSKLPGPLVVLVLAFLTVVGVQASASTLGRTYENLPRVDPELVSRSQTSAEPLHLIVRLSGAFTPEGALRSSQSQRDSIERRQDRILTMLALRSVENVRRFRHVPYLALEVEPAALADLVASPDVMLIQEDIPAPFFLAQSVPLIGADAAWAAGFTGAGQAIAIMDTGVASGHPFLQGKVIAEACFSGAFTPSSSLCPNGLPTQLGAGAGANCPSLAGCDHGTHVAGIAAGQGVSFSGVARDASVIAIQIFSRFDSDAYCGAGESPCILSWTADQIAALDYIYSTLRMSSSIAAVNMSLGGGTSTTTCNGDSRKAAIDNLRSVGIATVIAAGNGGNMDALSFPACISTAISVGSTTDQDAVSTFSNVASFLSLHAPGDGIQSSVPGGGFQTFSGTSMAAPHVAGAWAILRSKNPAASVDEVFSALASTGAIIVDSRPGGTVAKPRIQVDSAVSALQLPATPTPTPSPTPSPTPEPAGSTDWYLAEGYTGAGFTTFVLVQNPNETAAELDVEYQLEGGGVVTRQHTVPPNSRYTISAHDPTEVGTDAAFSVHVHSDNPVVVERAMYFPWGGHDTLGATTPATRWYLAEGFTGMGFETFVLIQNPTGSSAVVDTTYQLEGGGVVQRQHTVGAESRLTIAVQDPAELGPDQAFSVDLQSTVPIVVERAMYFPSGGHDAMAVTAPSNNWFLAEGFTGLGFQTFVLIQNPNGSPATVNVTYQLEGGGVISRQHVVAGQSRFTIGVQDSSEVGPDQAFSIALASDVPVVVERAMYFPDGGHDTMAVDEAANRWYLAEGFTGGGVATFVLVQNPNAAPASVQVEYQLQGSGVITRTHTVPGNARLTIAVHDPSELGPDQSFSIEVSSDQPIVVERAMYFGSDGHDTMGMPASGP